MIVLTRSFGALSLYFFLLSTCFFFFSHSLSLKASPCVQSKSCPHHDFEIIEPADPLMPIRLTFSVKQKNLDQLYTIVHDVSNPKSPNYGKFWSFEDIGLLTAHPEAKASVRGHLSKFLKNDQVLWSPYTSLIHADTNIHTAEKILGAKYHKFHSKKTGTEIIRSLQLDLPQELESLIDYISPAVHFPSVQPERTLETERQSGFIITPLILNSYYNITNNKVTTAATQSVFAAAGQNFSPTDLKSFQKTFKLPKDTVDKIIGGNNKDICTTNLNSCSEGNLDVQYQMSIAQNSETTWWNMGNKFLYEWILQLSATPNPPLVHSISYGTSESLGYSPEDQQMFSTEAAKLGARGVTIVAASGDDGVAGPNAQKGMSFCGFEPNFPATVPYVLAVGGTAGAEYNVSEVAAQVDLTASITSGGGFSKIFARPSYQDQVVSQYLSNSTVTSNSKFPPTTSFASGGRAYPDVAMAATAYWTLINGKGYLIGGTSAGTPVWAGIITLANNARLKKGKSALGFVNPALYQIYQSTPSIFNDITMGDNRCARKGTGTSPVCCQYGFVCGSGWDPVTGLGSVNVGRLFDALTAL